jgi:osmotically-inducible protein OsmY
MKVLPLFAVLLSALMLQGCIGLAVVGAAGVATKTASDPRTVGTQVDDSTLNARVANALTKDDQIQKQARIISTAYNGKILLTGQTPLPELAARAKQIAMKVDGVTEVYNEVRSGTPISLSTASSDAWITTKVRSQMLSSDQVKSSNVKITTENGEVFLMGLVTQEEGQAAAKIAAGVNGVQHVTTAFSFVK